MQKQIKEKILDSSIKSSHSRLTLPDHLQALHADALQKAKHYRRAEYELLVVIEKVERLKVFRRRGLSSLYEYIIKDLKLSEALAYHLITVARKMREVPALGKAIEENKVSVSKAKKMASVLTKDNQAQWLEKAQQLTSRQLERAVASENPKVAVPEKASYVSQKRLQLQLRRVQDLESQRLQRPARLEEALAAMAVFYLNKKDPQEKAKRSIARGSQRKKQGDDLKENQTRKKLQDRKENPIKNQKETTKHCENDSQPRERYSKKASDTQQFPGTVKIEAASSPEGKRKWRTPVVKKRSRRVEKTPERVKCLKATKIENSNSSEIPAVNRRALTATIQHKVRLRDKGRCTYTDRDGNRCSQRRWLDFHHVIPVAAGGLDSVDNLKLLCRGHHQMIHA